MALCMFKVDSMAEHSAKMCFRKLAEYREFDVYDDNRTISAFRHFKGFDRTLKAGSMFSKTLYDSGVDENLMQERCFCNDENLVFLLSMDVGNCVTGRAYFEITISLYTGFVHGLYSSTFGLYSASIFVHVYNMHLYTQGSPVLRCWPVTGRVTGSVAFE
eukprot:6212569-Pleurochrysis_carterae.AAC.1